MFIIDHNSSLNENEQKQIEKKTKDKHHFPKNNNENLKRDIDTNQVTYACQQKNRHKAMYIVHYTNYPIDLILTMCYILMKAIVLKQTRIVFLGILC